MNTGNPNISGNSTGLSRYSRQMLLPDIGPEGQQTLLGSHILLVGCGALGCASADLLARAGVGHITIVDRDIVELSNLQRQCLFDERDATEGLPKAHAAQRRLAAINSSITINAVVADFNYTNAAQLAADASILVDGTDNFQTRYLLNDLAVSLNRPYAYGGVVGTRGMQMTILPGKTACMRCLFDQMPAPGTTPTCDTAGVLGAAVSIVAACQACDTIKLLLGREDLLASSLLEFDLWGNQRRRIDLAKARNAQCLCCASHEFEFLNGDRVDATTTLCGQNAVQVLPARNGATLDLDALAGRLAAHGQFEANRFLLRGRLNNERNDDGQSLLLTVFADGRAIVTGTKRPEAAKSIVAKYIGA